MTASTEEPRDSAAILQAILDENNVDQTALAARIGSSRVAVNQVLNRRRSVTPLMALKLEAALGVSARQLLESQSVEALEKTYSHHRDELEAIRRNPIVGKPD